MLDWLPMLNPLSHHTQKLFMVSVRNKVKWVKERFLNTRWQAYNLTGCLCKYFLLKERERGRKRGDNFVYAKYVSWSCLPSFPSPFIQASFLSFLNIPLSQISAACMHTGRTIRSISNLPVDISPKKTDCPSPNSHQLSLAPQVGVGSYKLPFSFRVLKYPFILSIGEIKSRSLLKGGWGTKESTKILSQK